MAEDAVEVDAIMVEEEEVDQATTNNILPNNLRRIWSVITIIKMVMCRLFVTKRKEMKVKM
jgi:hypothetical protein